VDDSLRVAVEAQADALVRKDDAAFASYMTAQALVQLRNGHMRPSRFEVLSVDGRDDAGESVVRYAGRQAYVLRQRWERRDGAWKAIEAHPEDVPPALWRRVFRRVSGKDN
jgi:hypothetical protein